MLKNFTVPEKYSYPTRPITLTAEIPTWGYDLPDDEIKWAILERMTELVGDIPFDWEVLCEGYVFAVFFGLETWELALAAQARLRASNFDTHVWDEGVEDQVLGKLLRQAEAEGCEVEVYDENDERIDWEDDPALAERKSN
jgi:hypothetical protein